MTRRYVPSPPGFVVSTNAARSASQRSRHFASILRISSPFVVAVAVRCIESASVNDREARRQRRAGAGAASARGSRGAPSTASTMLAPRAVSYTHLRAHETRHDLVCRLLLEK